MKKSIRKILAGILATVIMCLALTACGSSTSGPAAEATPEAVPSAEAVGAAEYTIGICNYVDDASLNQIVENIQSRLAEIGEEKGVSFNIEYDNCNADAAVMEQIIANFLAEDVDLMIGVATPVAMRMQTATEDSKTPVVFSAVSDPVGAGLVESLDAPGANLTGTSDYLDTTAVMNLIFALKPDASKIGLLYDQGQDSSATAIAAAKAHLDEMGIEYVERTGTTTDEVMLAAQALVADGVDGEKQKKLEQTLYDPNPEEVFEIIVPEYLAGLLYSGVCESIASELAARRTAMDAATKNAGDMIEQLNLFYNRARQAGITQEITEIVAGAEGV